MQGQISRFRIMTNLPIAKIPTDTQVKTQLNQKHNAAKQTKAQSSSSKMLQSHFTEINIQTSDQSAYVYFCVLKSDIKFSVDVFFFF